jgi:hypothetical protein
MSDEQRDPDLEWIRSHWKAPEPSASLAVRVLASYRGQVSARTRKRWMWWVPIPVATAAVFALFTLWRPPAQSDNYRAVAHPRLIIVSQGEHP